MAHVVPMPYSSEPFDDEELPEEVAKLMPLRQVPDRVSDLILYNIESGVLLSPLRRGRVDCVDRPKLSDPPLLLPFVGSTKPDQVP